jgi:hypothetical protein
MKSIARALKADILIAMFTHMQNLSLNCILRHIVLGFLAFHAFSLSNRFLNQIPFSNRIYFVSSSAGRDITRSEIPSRPSWVTG